MNINPLALLLIGICTVAGYLAGSWAWGLLAGLVIVLIATLDPVARYDNIYYWARRQKARRQRRRR